MHLNALLLPFHYLCLRQKTLIQQRFYFHKLNKHLYHKTGRSQSVHVCCKASGLIYEELLTFLSGPCLLQVYGNWVLVWAVSDHPIGHQLLPNLNSSYVELKPQPDNKALEFIEWNIFMEKCVTYILNMTLPSDDDEHHSLTVENVEENDGVRKPFNESAELDFLESCDDCMAILYNSKTIGRYLMIYKSDGHHRDVDQLKTAQADHEKQAKCLGFPVEHLFIYNGTTDFCHKKSAPEEKTAEH
uniref:Uncharacterized protein n=1 Tax=Sphaeramia orbicularis TaxID=375764 RepID=A0A672YRG4_9TELE